MTRSSKDTIRRQPSFAIIRGMLAQSDRFSLLVDAAWLFASTILWNHYTFSATERENCKTLIRTELAGAMGTAKAFAGFCEMLIVSRLAAGGGGRSLPFQWFSGEEKKAASELLREIAEIRKSLPGYRRPVRALAEAILEMSEEGSKDNFLYWRRYFIEMNEPLLLEIFTLFCTNLQYLEK